MSDIPILLYVMSGHEMCIRDRALVVHEDKVFSGFGAELAAMIGGEMFRYLDGPVEVCIRDRRRITLWGEAHSLYFL